MKVGINLRLLNPGKIGGHERYVRSIISHLHIHYEELTLYLFVTKAAIHTFLPNSRIILLQIDNEHYGQSILKAIDEHDIDIYFCPLHVLEPILVHIPTVVNVPDIQQVYYPQFFTKEILKWRKLHYEASINLADAILTGSQFSADTFVQRMHANRAQIHVVHLAVDDGFGENIDSVRAGQVRTKYGLPLQYGYFPANTWPHKNHLALLDALVIHRERHGETPSIVLTGAKDTGHADLVQSIKSRKLDDDVTFLGYVPGEDLPYLYANAEFLVFPSLFEGFGFPIIEAMACNCPVICSNSTSLPEVAGEAALYFDPEEPSTIADAMYKVMSDDSIRMALVDKGRSQAGLYSWERAAHGTMAVFKNLIHRPLNRRTSGPLVTIVTPSYNQGAFIEETIQSVLGQNYSPLEYIVVDGGSTDKTIEILAKYQNMLQWTSEPDRGQGDAVNKGFRKAKGEILGWINSDDTYLPGAIEEVVKIFESRPDIVMVYGNGYYTNIDSIITDRYPSEPFDLKRLAEICFICQPSVFLRRSIFDAIGEININLKTCMDFDYWIRIGKKYEGRIYFTQRYLATSRMYEQNKTLSMREKVYEEIFETVKKHFEVLPDSWLEGFINDVIKGIYIKQAPWPFNKLLYWYYIYKFRSNFDLVKLISYSTRMAP